jgi:glutamyl-tRNA synthetase
MPDVDHSEQGGDERAAGGRPGGTCDPESARSRRGRGGEFGGGVRAGDVTRLAPSPTGALHLGNARTFLVNWALARRHGWRIVLRIEDLDGPRVKPGAIEQTIDLLSWLGMDWDEGPIVQSHDLEPYRAAMRTLATRGRVYPSELTRSEIESAASAPQEGSHEVVFPASLRPTERPREFLDENTNWRLAVDAGEVEFIDGFAGPQRFEPAGTIGDFIVWTKRAQPSYQLAVVVDDHRQGVTRIVRGDDLLESAARQLMLARMLGLKDERGHAWEPDFTHLPLVRGADGRRLAKRHGDTRLDTYRSAGVPAERVIGLIAAWCGIGRREMSAAEFRETLDPGTIPKDAVVMTGEDDGWLRSREAGARTSDKR